MQQYRILFSRVLATYPRAHTAVCTSRLYHCCTTHTLRIPPTAHASFKRERERERVGERGGAISQRRAKKAFFLAFWTAASMSSAAVEQVPPEPAAFVDIDLEANTTAAAPGANISSSSARQQEQQAAVGEEGVIVDIESGSAVVPPPPPIDSPSGRPTSGTFSHGDVLALLLGLVSVVRHDIYTCLMLALPALQSRIALAGSFVFLLRRFYYQSGQKCKDRFCCIFITKKSLYFRP